PTGQANDGEVEDHTVTIEPAPEELDFGDAPDPNYPTLLNSNGARHVIGGPYFCDDGSGDAPDAEPNGQPNATATGDDGDADGDDEDGVVFPTLIAGQPGLVDVNVCGGGGIVELWIDYNGDGDWDDPCEFEFSGWMGNGPDTVLVDPPADSVPGTTFARCRISTAGVLLPTGQANDGEVEDHTVTIEPAPEELDFGDAPDPNYPTLLLNRTASLTPRPPAMILTPMVTMKKV
ncbi:MAG: GEVED domain-containing protein, partial [Planctomycetota bacterium]